MKDSTALGIAGMACVTATYATYLVTGAATGSLAPDGIILSGVVGAICALGGVIYALKGNNVTKEP